MWKRLVAVCLACIAVALALGTLIPSPFVQNVAADFVGGLVAGLVIFAVADAALGFTERRETERRALRIAMDLLVPELMDNLSELQRIANVLRQGSLTFSDPVFRDECLSAEKWQLLVQGPLVAHLPPDLLWKINGSYYVARHFVKELRDTRSHVMALNAQGWRDLCDKHLPTIEMAVKSVETTLRIVRASMGRA